MHAILTPYSLCHLSFSLVAAASLPSRSAISASKPANFFNSAVSSLSFLLYLQHQDNSHEKMDKFLYNIPSKGCQHNKASHNPTLHDLIL